MLGKLLKYEIPALGRKLVPLYIGWAATAVLLGVALGMGESESGFMIVLAGLLYSAAATAVIVMAVVMIVQRYHHSLLGDEGYFSHVLPVSASVHIANKTIAALVWVLISGVALIVTGLLIAIFSGSISDLLNIDWEVFIGDLANMGAKRWLLLFEFLILFTLSIGKSILAIYTALTIGHQARRRTTLASIGAYFGVLVFEMLIGRILVEVMPFMADLYTGGFRDVQIFILCSAAITIAIGAVYFFICKYLMEKKLNLS